MTMTRQVPVALFVLGGIALSLGGLAILLFGVWYAAFALAWSNYSASDLMLIAAILLYAMPAGAALLYGATWAFSSATAEAAVPTTVQARRTMGAILLLPCLATAVALGLGYPHYRFWLGTSTDGALMVVLALLLAGVGVWLTTRADVARAS
jgi:hypothetical protein